MRKCIREPNASDSKYLSYAIHTYLYKIAFLWKQRLWIQYGLDNCCLQNSSEPLSWYLLAAVYVTCTRLLLQQQINHTVEDLWEW